MKKGLLLLLTVMMVIGLGYAKLPKGLENKVVDFYYGTKAKDIQLTYTFFHQNDINSAICNHAEYIYHFSNEGEIADYYGMLFPYSYVGNTDEEHLPLNYVYQITPNLHAFVQFPGQSEPDLSSEVVLRPSGMEHHGEFGAGNPGPITEDNFTDWPFTSTMQVTDTLSGTSTYLWYQYYLSPTDPSQCDTLNPDYSYSFYNNWDWGLNTDYYGLNYYQNPSLYYDVLDFSPTGQDVHGLIGKANLVAFMDDFNAEAQTFINTYTYAGNPNPHLPLYLQMQKYFYETEIGAYNNAIILNYRITNVSDKIGNELPALSADLLHGDQLPITLRGLQFSLFVDPDMGDDYLDDRVHAVKDKNMLIYTDNNGVGDVSIDTNGDGIPEIFHNVPERGVATIFLGAAKGTNDNTNASEETYYMHVNAIRNLTAERYREGYENNNYGNITQDPDTTDIQKRWLWFNTYFYPREFTSAAQEAFFENLPPHDNDPDLTDGYDAWGCITVGSKTTAPTTNEVTPATDETASPDSAAIRPVPKDQWIYPTNGATQFSDIFDPNSELTLGPGEHITFSFAFIVSNDPVTEANWQNELDETNPNTLGGMAKFIKDRYPLYQMWPTPANFWAGTNIVGIDNNVPAGFAVTNYPNPFNPSTTIQFTVPSAQKINVTVYNINGQKVKTLYNGMAEGTKSLVWNGTDNNDNHVASGVYFYKVSGKNINVTKKMVMLK